MSTDPRFGLKPLPLAKKDKAVVGEILLDNNTGHFYNKKPDGTIFSKTLELENRLNELIMNQQFWRSTITMNGVDIKRFTTNANGLNTESTVYIRPSVNTVVLDKLPFDVNRMSRYRVSILYGSNSTNKFPIPELHLHRNHSNSNDETLYGYLLTKSRRNPSVNNEMLITYDVSLASSDIGGEGYLVLNEILGLTIKHIKVEEIPLFDEETNELSVTPADINTIKIASGKGVVTTKTVGATKYKTDGYFNVYNTQDLIISTDQSNLQPGLYAITIIMEGAITSTTVYGTYKDTDYKNASGVGSKYQTNNPMNIVDIPPFMGGSKSDPNNLKAFTTIIPVGKNALDKIVIKANGGTASNCNRVYHVSLKMISTGSYNHTNC